MKKIIKQILFLTCYLSLSSLAADFFKEIQPDDIIVSDDGRISIIRGQEFFTLDTKIIGIDFIFAMVRGHDKTIFLLGEKKQQSGDSKKGIAIFNDNGTIKKPFNSYRLVDMLDIKTGDNNTIFIHGISYEHNTCILQIDQDGIVCQVFNPDNYGLSDIKLFMVGPGGKIYILGQDKNEYKNYIVILNSNGIIMQHAELYGFSYIQSFTIFKNETLCIIGSKWHGWSSEIYIDTVSSDGDIKNSLKLDISNNNIIDSINIAIDNNIYIYGDKHVIILDNNGDIKKRLYYDGHSAIVSNGAVYFVVKDQAHGSVYKFQDLMNRVFVCNGIKLFQIQ